MLGSSLGTGKKFSIRGAFVYDFMEGKIREIRMYYDSSIMKKQLEILKNTGIESG
jgi:ketosteroid isomerase-like protein